MTSTPTREETSRSRVAVTLSPDGGRCRVVLGVDGPADRPVVRPVLLSSDDHGARVSLVPEGALLLRGDQIRIAVHVGPGARLELVEPGGTVAYAMDGGRASWEVSIHLGTGARLTWAGEPFIVSHGAMVDRRSSVHLGDGAVLALRETLVLGRAGERAGTVRQVLSVDGASGDALLVEELIVSESSGRLLLGGARAMGTVLLLGARLAETAGEGTRLDLESGGTLVRALASEAHLALPASAWADAVQVARAI